MISRQQINHFQENPSLHTRPIGKNQNNKTPLRQGLSTTNKNGLATIMTTGAKGFNHYGGTERTAVKTNGVRTVGRILGNKDANLARKDQTASLLFTAPSKASTHASTSSCAFKPTPTTLPAHLRTPSPAVQQHAVLSLSPGEIEVLEEEMEEEPEEVEMGDVEVEGASGSSRNYEEPFVPEFAMMNFKEVGIGRLLKSVPIWAGDEDWEIRDEEERRQVRAVMIIEDERKYTPLSDVDDSTPLFPVPKRRALASKSNLTNAARSTPLLRKPVISTQSRPSSLTTSHVSFATKPTVARSLISSKPKWGATAASTPSTLHSSTSQLRPTSTTHNSIRAPRAPLTGTDRLKKPAGPSTVALRAVVGVTTSPVHSNTTVEEEAALGIFGIVGGEYDLMELLKDEGMQEESDGAFRFEL